MLPGEIKYPHVFKPGRIGKVEVKNRIKYASTETNFNYGDGFVSDREVAYMEAQARGGAGMVTTQGAYTDPRGEGKGYVGMMAIHDDRFIPGLKKIADVIRAHGARSVCQLMHCGRVGGVELSYTVGPSQVPQRIPRFREPVEMTREQIEQEIENHAQGARRIVEAGFDMVEISGIVGYLISNFISSYTNKRTDEYGGDVRGRAKFMTDIVRACRRQVGPDVPIIIRLCGDELLHDRGGNTPEESLAVITLAEEAGIDCLSVTAGWQESADTVISRDRPQGSWLYIAEKMKKNLKVPVAMAYRLFQPEIPDKAIGDGVLDFWESCRAMIADPFLPLKIMEDRQEDIIPCMACNMCLARLFRDAELTCMVRPSLGHEREHAFGFYGFEKAEKKKKVVVIGAGIAGMQAAAIAAEKGHAVTVYDKSDHTGGQFAAASRGPWGDDEFMRLVNYLETRCRKAGAELVLNTELSKEQVAALGADEVIAATGALPKKDYPGADRPSVVSCLDVLEGKVDVGEKVVILGNKGAGISVALFLLNKGGHQVTMVGKGKKVGTDVNPSYIWRYRMKLKQGKAVLVTDATVKEITDAGVVVKTPEGGEQTIEAQTVILAEMEENDALSKSRKGIFTIGDALIVRRGNNAILDGYRMGMRL